MFHYGPLDGKFINQYLSYCEWPIICNYCGNQGHIGSIKVKIPPPPGAKDLGKYEERKAVCCANCGAYALLYPGSEWGYDNEMVIIDKNENYIMNISICRKCNGLIDPSKGGRYTWSRSGYVGHVQTIVESIYYHKECIPEEYLNYKEPDPPKGLCFIATAVYGSPMAPEISVLQDFRNNVLIASFIGRIFVGLYNIVGPHCAIFIKDNTLLKAIIRRFIIEPLVVLVRKYK